MRKSFVELDKALFESEFDIYFKYLDYMESFIASEVTAHKASLDEIERQGRLTYSDDPYQMPPELEYDNYHLVLLDQFANIMRRSYFVSLCSSVETTLVEHTLYKDATKKFRRPDRDVVRKTLDFLIKAGLTNYVKSILQWQTITYFIKLRNAFVHDDGRTTDKALLNFIQKTPGLTKTSAWIELDYPFCKIAMETVLSFLVSVLF